jgi:hypothetical protein
VNDEYVNLIKSASVLLTGSKRRKFIAEVVNTICNGNTRSSEEIFGWSRITAAKGIDEENNNYTIKDKFHLRGKKKLNT